MVRSGRHLERLRSEPWTSWDTAVAIVGCSRERIAAAIAAGEIEQRPVEVRWMPSLRPESVEAWGRRWRAAEAARRRRDTERERARAAALKVEQPPDDGYVWLDATTAAIVLGISRVRVAQLARADRIPHVRRGRRLWFRRDLLEQYQAARAARRRSVN